MNKKIIVNTDDVGKRLDVYLTEKMEGQFSRSQIKRLIVEGDILVNEENQKPHYTLKGKEEIDLTLPEKRNSRILPEDIPIDIVYEDKDILVVNKPSGMVVHPAAGNPDHTLVNALLFHADINVSHRDNCLRPGIVHRLDKEVSGLMVVAKTDLAYQYLVKQFQNRSIRRTYIAFVKGLIPQNEGEIVLPIGRAARNRKKMAVRFSNSKDAITRYKVIKRFTGHTKLRVNIETGRTHQIRVHLSYIGHPIIGDARYGGGGSQRIALYAEEIAFNHPKTNKELNFSIDIPEELRSLNMLY